MRAECGPTPWSSPGERAEVRVSFPTRSSRWLYAIKPGSWPKLMAPMALGQCLGWTTTGQGSVSGIVFGLAFTLTLGVFIVLLNDWGDQRVDAIKRERFPDGCSPKTIPDRILTPRQVLLAAMVSAAAHVGIGLFAGWWYGSIALALSPFVALFTFTAYTLPPLKLNYRGGGELLEGWAVGFLLPWLHALLQGAPLLFPQLLWLAGLIPLSLASALASGLSDEESDREGGKVTFTTRFGNRPVRTAIESLVLLGLGLWWGIALMTQWLPWWTLVLVTAPALVSLERLHAQSPRAVTRAFAAQKVYKGHLARLILWSVATLAAALVIHFLW